MAALLAALALFGGTPSVALRITVWPKGQPGPARVWTLRCAPASGTLPKPLDACLRVGRMADDPFAPVPPDVVCTQLYGGPQKALVTGTFRGRRVWARFDRHDSCQTARWDRIRFLLVAAPPAG